MKLLSPLPNKVWNGKLGAHATVAQLKPSQKQIHLLEILKAANRPMTVAELMTIIGDGPSSVRSRLIDLESMKMVVSYALTGTRKGRRIWQLSTMPQSGSANTQSP